MSRAHRPEWGALPDRWAWLRLLAAPSSYLLALALIVTVITKLRAVASLSEVSVWPLHGLVASASDVAVFLGLAAILAVGEQRSRWLAMATLPVALVVSVVGLGSAAFLSISGEQLNWQIMSVGISRFGDVSGILAKTVAVAPFAVVGFVIAVAIPIAVRLWLRRTGHAVGDRAKPAAIAAVLGLAVAVIPASHALALQRLHGNAVVHTYWGMVTGDKWGGGTHAFTGYRKELATPEAIAALRAGARPNVVVVILESTRRDETELGGGPIRTPNLVAVAARGLEETAGRAVIPYTSKSVWSMLCARLPLLEPKLYEIADSIDVQCLPAILDAAGWRTGFFQSALGTFEDRPRLAHRLGFRDFVAAEDTGASLLGYLGSDDEALRAPVGAWLERGEPFFATVLTSATHHPYDVSKATVARAQAEGLPVSSDRERYDRQLEAEDRLLGGIVEDLRRHGLLERTIIVALGDHGEGFGDRGIREHATNFFDEGLRVPWVIAGPGIPHRRDDADVSLVDLTPTLLDALGVAIAPADARSLLHAAPTDRLLPFSCWYDGTCRGFVQAHQKIVAIPETGETFWFDLAADPDERDPLPLTEALRARLGDADAIVDAHRTTHWPTATSDASSYPGWSCPADKPCTPSGAGSKR